MNLCELPDFPLASPPNGGRRRRRRRPDWQHPKERREGGAFLSIPIWLAVILLPLESLSLFFLPEVKGGSPNICSLLPPSLHLRWRISATHTHTRPRMHVSRHSNKRWRQSYHSFFFSTFVSASTELEGTSLCVLAIDNPTANAGMQNGSSQSEYVHIACTFLQVWHRFVCSVGAY